MPLLGRPMATVQPPSRRGHQGFSLPVARAFCLAKLEVWPVVGDWPGVPGGGCICVSNAVPPDLASERRSASEFSVGLLGGLQSVDFAKARHRVLGHAVGGFRNLPCAAGRVSKPGGQFRPEGDGSTAAWSRSVPYGV